jgi:hypothetical protein
MGKTWWITSLGLASKELQSIVSIYKPGFKLDNYQRSFYNICRDMFGTSICNQYEIGKQIEILATTRQLLVAPNMTTDDVNLFCQYVRVNKMVFSRDHSITVVQNKRVSNIIAEGSLPRHISHFGSSRRICTNKFAINYNAKTKKLTINSFAEEWAIKHFMKLTCFLHMSDVIYIDIVAKNVYLPTCLSWIFPKLQLIRASVEKICYGNVLMTCNRVVLKIKRTYPCGHVVKQNVYL